MSTFAEPWYQNHLRIC